MSEAFKQFIELIQENRSFTFIVVTSFIIAMFFSLAVIFYKIKQKPWKALIPIYNHMVLMEILDIPVWMFLVMVIPFVNIVGIPFILVLVGWKLGAYCRKGYFMRIGLILCPPLFFPLLAASYIDLDGTGRYVMEPVKVDTSFSLKAVEVADIGAELGAMSLGHSEVIDRIAPIMATRKIEAPKDSVTVKKDFNEVEAMSSANEVEDLKRVLPTADDLTFDYNSLYKESSKPKEEVVEVPSEKVEEKPDFELAESSKDESTIDYNELYKNEVTEAEERTTIEEKIETTSEPIEEEPKIIIHEVALEAAEPVEALGPIPINKRYDFQSKKSDAKATEVAAIHDVEAKEEIVEETPIENPEETPLPNPFENMEENISTESVAEMEISSIEPSIEETSLDVPEINPMAPPVIAPFIQQESLTEEIPVEIPIVEEPTINVSQPVVEPVTIVPEITPSIVENVTPVQPVIEVPQPMPEVISSTLSQTPVTVAPEITPSVVLEQVEAPVSEIVPSSIPEVTASVPEIQQSVIIPEVKEAVVAPQIIINQQPIEQQQVPIVNQVVSVQQPALEPVVTAPEIAPSVVENVAPVQPAIEAPQIIPPVSEASVSNLPSAVGEEIQNQGVSNSSEVAIPKIENNQSMPIPQNNGSSLDLPVQAASPFGADGLPGLAEVPDLSLPNVNAVPEIDVPEINLTEQAMQGMRERTTIEPGTRVDQIVSMNIAEPDQLPVGVLMKPQPVAPPIPIVPQPQPQPLPQPEMTRAEAMGIKQNFFTDVVPNGPKMGESFQQPMMNNIQQQNLSMAQPMVQQPMMASNTQMMQPMPMNQPIMNGNINPIMNYSQPMNNMQQQNLSMGQPMMASNAQMMQPMPMNQPMMNGNGVNPMDPTSIFQVNSGNGPLLRPMENNSQPPEKVCPVCGVKLKPDCPICIMCGFKF